MSKAEGKNIGISFDAKIVTKPYYIPNDVNKALNKPYTSNGTINNRGYSATDGNTETARYIEVSGTDMYIQVDLEEEVNISKIKVWHYYSDGRIYNNAKTEVSLDGENWTTIYDSNVDGTYSETLSGKEHILESVIKARYVRDWINGSDKNTGNHWVEIMVYDSCLGFKVEPFTITGNEYKYVNGPSNNGEVISMNYPVEKVELHPTITDAILLTIKTPYEFNNVLGNLKINYDNTKGDLMGRGGLIESFEREFAPTDLVLVPDIGIHDSISSSVGENTIEFKSVIYASVNDGKTDKISTSPGEVMIEFQYVGIVDP